MKNYSEETHKLIKGENVFLMNDEIKAKVKAELLKIQSNCKIVLKQLKPKNY